MGEFLAKIDRLQKSPTFMKIATVVLILLAAGVFITVWLNRGPVPTGSSLALEFNPDKAPAELAKLTPEQAAAFKDEVERFNRSLEAFTTGQGDLTSVAVGIGALTAVLIASVWLGISLSILGLLILGAAITLPLNHFEATRSWGRLFGGVLALSLSFTVVMRSLNLVLSLPGAMFAIARNTVAEATRMRISVIFIAALLFGLAALPMLLDPSVPLRYRVQSFLQYSTGGAFWIIALLVVLFSVSTIATEQRDKIIWQTMTKPVAAWQYILGKWLGVVTLAAGLLCVSGMGIFLFVEFLRYQPAQGEIGPFRAADGGLSEDRQWLESQILTARVTIDAEPENMKDADPPRFAEVLEAYLSEIGRANSSFDPNDPVKRREAEGALVKSLETYYRQIPPLGSFKTYTFKDLSQARNRNLPIIFRFRIDAGSNPPDKLYKITFGLDNYGTLIKDTFLGQYQSLTLPPTVIREDGTFSISVFNGALQGVTAVSNPDTISFPKDGLVTSYSVGSYRVNFVRVVFALWMKLAFLAMTGIFAGSFLSFPVASLVSFLVLVMAESTPTLTKALVVFDEMDAKGNVVLWRLLVVRIAQGTSALFRTYGDLQPTKRLVEGLLLSWSEVAFGMTILALLTVVLYVCATAIFRKRELAIYSGH